MATALHIASPVTSCPRHPYPRSAPGRSLTRLRAGSATGSRWRAMVQSFQGGPSASYAREIERLSAKEALLLAFKDAGGFQSAISGKATEMQRIDVNERIVSLERLNPTTRPTTSPFLEGRWNFEWIAASSPGSLAARFLFERSPANLAYLLGLDMVIKDGYSKVTAKLKLLNSIQTKFLITTKLSVEGPVRMKEEYVEGTFEAPNISEEAIPEQLKGFLGQASGSLQQLPAPIKDVLDNGVKVPLSGIFQRMFLISYLDEEILIIRDSFGAPDVLTRLDGPPTPTDSEPILEYDS